MKRCKYSLTQRCKDDAAPGDIQLCAWHLSVYLESKATEKYTGYWDAMLAVPEPDEVTTEMFEAKMAEVSGELTSVFISSIPGVFECLCEDGPAWDDGDTDEMSAAEMLATPGVMELVRESLNNEVIDACRYDIDTALIESDAEECGCGNGNSCETCR